MTETPQHPSQNPYVAGPAAQDDGAPQPSPFGPGADRAPQAAAPQAAAAQPTEPLVVTAQTGEFAWGAPIGHVPPGGMPPVPPGLMTAGAPQRRGPRRIGLSITVAVAVLAAAIGGVSGACLLYTSPSPRD